MYRKIDIYINGVHEFSTCSYPSCKVAVNEIRSRKHIEIASAPKNRYLTVCDYDTVRAKYAR